MEARSLNRKAEFRDHDKEMQAKRSRLEEGGFSLERQPSHSQLLCHWNPPEESRSKVTKVHSIYQLRRPSTLGTEGGRYIPSTPGFRENSPCNKKRGKKARREKANSLAKAQPLWPSTRGVGISWILLEMWTLRANCRPINQTLWVGLKWQSPVDNCSCEKCHSTWLNVWKS